jgi:hypothetical protein
MTPQNQNAQRPAASSPKTPAALNTVVKRIVTDQAEALRKLAKT